MEVRKGYVEHIVFRNNDNGYTVFQLVSEEEELTCVGLFSVLAEGELVQVSGYMKEHPLYGEQVPGGISNELLAPEDETGHGEISGKRSYQRDRSCYGGAYCPQIQRGYLPHY